MNLNIQSASVVVPSGKRCVNDCPFCVSRMSEDLVYKNLWQEDIHNFKYYKNFGTDEDYKSRYNFEAKNRLEFIRNNNCNTLILTGQREPLQNKKFIENFFKLNSELRSPFLWIELQSTGVYLTDENLLWLAENNVKTISLSVNDIFNDENNLNIIGGRAKKENFKLEELCNKIKSFGFNLRLSVNLIKVYDYYTPLEIFERLRDLGADQITFRVFYTTEENNTPEDGWISENRCISVYDIDEFIIENGNKLEKLSFGARKYSVMGMSVVIDDDCMAQKDNKDNVYKYVILEKNGKLYSRWNDKGSLIY